MVGSTLGGIPGPLSRAVRQGRWWRFTWSFTTRAEARPVIKRLASMERMRYHLGRGRRARDAGRFEEGAAEAQKALDANPRNPWAMALLGQCLARQRTPDLSGARRSLERAWTLDPTNGYFVGLLLDVLDAQGDAQARTDLLEWAWWSGAPVERWLPDGPPSRRVEQEPVAVAAAEPGEPVRPVTAAPVFTADHRDQSAPSPASVLVNRQPVHA